MYGSVLAVGDYTSGSQNAAVYILVDQANTNDDNDVVPATVNYTMTQMLTGSVAGGRFGQSISLISSFLAVGAPGIGLC
jgi:hypothetical protein